MDIQNGHYLLSYEDENGETQTVGGGGVAIDAFGRERPLTEEELEQLKQRLAPSIFFSGDLCARYFTYMSRDNGAHFVLFDDGDTLRHKVEVARELGIRTFLAPWAEVAPHAARIGILRKPEPRQGRR